MITRTCALASYLEARILAEPRWNCWRRCSSISSAFATAAADPNKVNGEIVIDIQESGIAVPSTTLLEGQIAIRAAIVNHRTETCDLDALVAAIIKFGTAEPIRSGQPTAQTGRMRCGRRLLSDGHCFVAFLSADAPKCGMKFVRRQGLVPC